MDKREEILNEAKTCVCGDRDKSYGKPEDNFDRIAGLWQAYLGVRITKFDVAAMMILMKMARIKATGGEHRDSWVDAAGYAACGGSMVKLPFE